MGPGLSHSHTTIKLKQSRRETPAFAPMDPPKALSSIGFDLPLSTPTGYPDDSTQSQTVASIDIPINTANKTWIRVFHPINLPSNPKLPILFYFHGGGFINHSAASAPFHEGCSRMALELPALILSLEYRKAPQNRLPSAYEDAVDAMLWLKKQALYGEHRFASVADFTNCFLMGTSSGGNLAYHAGLNALRLDLEPVKITRLILNQPFFGGEERTESELRSVNDPKLSLTSTDLAWKLVLPLGADRDHQYSNPMAEGSNRLEIQKLPRCYVNGYGGDLLVERQKQFVKMLKEHGICVVDHFVDDGYHWVEMFEPEKALESCLVDRR